MFKKFLFVLLNIVSAFAVAMDGTGLQISASVDLVGQASLKKGSGNDRLAVRGGEFMFSAPADYLFDATVSFAAHDEDGFMHFEIHEAWAGSTKLIPRSRFRLGKFFLGVGRLNQFHLHDWPFISAPRVQKDFFAFEGANDVGLEYSYLLPLGFFLELTGGVTNGFTFGHEHGSGSRPYFPTHYLRAATYTSLPSNGGAQIALNYLGRSDSTNTKMALFGIDFTAKWKEAKVLDWLIQSEVWYRIQSPQGSETRKQWGFYVYPQHYLGGNLFIGCRVDYFSDLSRPATALGGTSKNFELGIVPTITYQPSEFSTFRLAYNFKPEYLVDRFTNTNHYLEAQAVFIIGAHPAHDF